MVNDNLLIKKHFANDTIKTNEAAFKILESYEKISDILDKVNNALNTNKSLKLKASVSTTGKYERFGRSHTS